MKCSVRRTYQLSNILFIQNNVKNHGALIIQITILNPTCAQSLQSCPTLWDPMDYSLPGSSVLGILQARILEWVAMPSFKWSPLPRDGNCVSCIVGGFLTAEPLEKPLSTKGTPQTEQGRGGLLEERELPVNSPTPHAHKAVCLQTCWFCFQSLS